MNKKVRNGVIMGVLIIILLIVVSVVVVNLLGKNNKDNLQGYANSKVNDTMIVTNNENKSENNNSVMDTNNSNTDASTVYMTKNISPEGLMKVYQQLGFEPTGNVAEEHGFTAIADVDIMDEEGSMTIPTVNGKHLSVDTVGSHFANYDSFIVLSHFKGHAMAGFGGAIKNISIGIASSEGKAWIHSGGTSKTNIWGGKQDDFLESMGEAGGAVVNSLDGKIVYVNVLNRLSVDCDCDGNPAEPDIHDIGILASTDPVAIDKASIDLVFDAEGSESFKQRVNSRNGLHTLDYAEQIGLGNQKYRLVSIDDPNN